MSVSFKPVLAAMLLGGCVTAVSAQSSVSLYGLMDVSAGQFQGAGAVKDRKVNSGSMTTSYLGFGGVEDLDGGLKARFALEGFMRPTSGESGRSSTDTMW